MHTWLLKEMGDDTLIGLLVYDVTHKTHPWCIKRPSTTLLTHAPGAATLFSTVNLAKVVLDTPQTHLHHALQIVRSDGLKWDPFISFKTIYFISFNTITITLFPPLRHFHHNYRTEEYIMKLFPHNLEAGCNQHPATESFPIIVHPERFYPLNKWTQSTLALVYQIYRNKRMFSTQLQHHLRLFHNSDGATLLAIRKESVNECTRCPQGLFVRTCRMKR